MDVRRAIAWLVVATTMIGCPSAHAPVDPEQRALFDAIFDASCRRSLACTRDAWVSGARCDGQAYEERLLETGQLYVDAELAAQCIAALDALGSCVVRQPNTGWLWDDFPPPADAWDDLAAADLCNRAFQDRGSHVFPQTCGSSECALDAVCVTDASCARRCVTLAGEGEPCGIGCNGTVRCESGVCVPRMTRADCIASGAGHLATRDGSCLPDVGELGDACDPARDFCIASALCAPTQHRCVDRPSPGEPCVDGAACDNEETCQAGVCVTVAPAMCSCDTDRYCTSDRICGSNPEGTFCLVHSFETVLVDSCPEGFSCAFGQCVRTIAVGDACDPSSLCIEGATCRDGRCEPIAGVGGCPAAPCPASYACRDGTCRLDLPGLGEACDLHDCTDGSVCTGGVCVRPPTLALGASCVFDGDCSLDAACVDGVCARYALVTSGGTCRFFTAMWGPVTDCEAGLSCRPIEGGGDLCCP